MNPLWINFLVAVVAYAVVLFKSTRAETPGEVLGLFAWLLLGAVNTFAVIQGDWS